MSQESPSKPDKKSYNRPPLHTRQYIVDKPFQYRMIGLLFTIWFANSAFFSIVLYFLFEGHLNLFYDIVPKEGMYPLLTLPALLVAAVAFVAVFGIVVLGIMALFTSNQIAGPLYRTKLSMDRLIEGDWNFTLKFRETDFLNDFPPVFNALLENLRERSASDIEDLKAIERASSDDDVATLARGMRERKEALLGIAAEDVAGDGEEQDRVSVAVH